MASIGGPGGIGGPKGPTGPEGPDDVAEVADAADAGGVERAAQTAHAPDINALIGEIAAGRLTAREAIDRLVDAAATPDMDASERAELREMLTDLVANDPYLSGLANRV